MTDTGHTKHSSPALTARKRYITGKATPMGSTAKRCKHPDARVVRLEGNMATIRCDACELTLYTPAVPYVSRHACRRVHKAPKWAQRLIDAYRTDDEVTRG